MLPTGDGDQLDAEQAGTFSLSASDPPADHGHIRRRGGEAAGPNPKKSPGSRVPAADSEPRADLGCGLLEPISDAVERFDHVERFVDRLEFLAQPLDRKSVV